jgi:DNA-binding CsgD family transcriptional regulator
MPALRSRDSKAVDDLVGELAAVRDFAALRMRLLHGIVNDLVPADDASVDDLDFQAHTSNWVSIRPLPGEPERRAILSRHFHEHPVLDAYQKPDAPMVMRLTDLLPFRFFERRPLFQQMYEPIGLKYQLTMGLTRGTRCYAVTFLRTDRDFSDRDLAVLELAAPRVAPLFQAALEREQLRTALSAVASGRGVIYLGAGDEMLWANDRGRELLGTCFGCTDAGRVPPVIARWLRMPAEPLRHQSAELEVVVQLVGDGRERVLLLETPAPEPTAELLQPLGLTPRQAEVLFWIARGKTNGEIGIILGASVHTIHRHAEAIYGRLHVESRSAAAVIAMQVIGV